MQPDLTIAATERQMDRPVELFNKPRLEDLAAMANASHRACETMARSAIHHARECGETLALAKAELPHGQWGPWLAKHCEFSERQAQRYLKVYHGWDRLCGLDAGVSYGKPKTTRASDFSLEGMTIRSAMRMLSGEDPEAKPPKTGSSWLVTGVKCPSCGATMIRTSARYHTCGECADCRLHGNSDFQPGRTHKPAVCELFHYWSQTPIADREYFLSLITKKPAQGPLFDTPSRSRPVGELEDEAAIYHAHSGSKKRPRLYDLSDKSRQSYDWGNSGFGTYHGLATFNYAEFPNAVVESSLSDILEPAGDVPQQCYLSEYNVKRLIERMEKYQPNDSVFLPLLKECLTQLQAAGGAD